LVVKCNLTPRLMTTLNMQVKLMQQWIVLQREKIDTFFTN
jgi:hypothetical protein